MKKLSEIGGLEIWKYTPSATKPFYIDMEPTTIMRRARFLIDYLYGYSVYYLKQGDTFVGYCTITSGKNPRFWFATDADIIVGPYYVEESFRGHGYSKLLVKEILDKYETEWNHAYVYIRNTNTASIRTVEALGAKLLYHVHNTFTRKLVKTQSGEYGVYQIEKK